MKYVRKEIELLNQLRHKNILRHLGACVEGGTLHPLTEFIEGGDLETLLHVSLLPLFLFTESGQ